MARVTKPRAKRKPKASFRDEYDSMPSGNEAAVRWKQFMQRLDELNEHCCELADLGETLVQALRENAETTGSPLLGLINRVAENFRAARRQYAGRDRFPPDGDDRRDETHG